MLRMMYPHPQAVQYLKNKNGDVMVVDYEQKFLKKHVHKFYEDVFRTVMKFGRIAEMRVVDNLCEHLLGNVYIKFESEDAAAAAVDGLTKKSYQGIVLLPELSPVVDFADACCKESSDGECKRGQSCNFWHVRRISQSLMDSLEKSQTKYWKKHEKELAKAAPPPPPPPTAPNQLLLWALPNATPAATSASRADGEKPRKEKDRKRSRSRSHSRRRDRSRRRTEKERDRTPPKIADDRICHICGKPGHLSRHCPMRIVQ